MRPERIPAKRACEKGFSHEQSNNEEDHRWDAGAMGEER